QARIATWNPARSVWETDQASICGHSEPFSETWPTSGMMRAGTAYALPTSVPLTDDSGSSLLPTPRASDGPDSTSHGRSWSSTDRNLHTLVKTGELSCQHPEQLTEPKVDPTSEGRLAI